MLSRWVGFWATFNNSELIIFSPFFQTPVKLFMFEGGNWVERGRGGQLRLNDSNSSSSRLIYRTKGNLRLLLNMVVWEGMKVERASEKSVRFTGFNAADNEQQQKIGIFLVSMVRAVLNYIFNYFAVETNVYLILYI